LLTAAVQRLLNPAAAPSLCLLDRLFCLQFLLLLTALLIWEVIYIIVSAVQYKVCSCARLQRTAVPLRFGLAEAGGQLP
jgi:hypothetical protein